eukprot:762724-Hanusia_phi.AAC.2
MLLPHLSRPTPSSRRPLALPLLFSRWISSDYLSPALLSSPSLPLPPPLPPHSAADLRHHVPHPRRSCQHPHLGTSAEVSLARVKLAQGFLYPGANWAQIQNLLSWMVIWSPGEGRTGG